MLTTGGSEFADAASCQALVKAIGEERKKVAGFRFAAEMIVEVMDVYLGKNVDPKSFARFAAEALADFPEIVVFRMADPRTGIARECKFAPTVAEFVQWCERDEAAMSSALATAERRLAHISRRERLARDGLIYDVAPTTRENWSRISTPFIGVKDRKGEE